MGLGISPQRQQPQRPPPFGEVSGAGNYAASGRLRLLPVPAAKQHRRHGDDWREHAGIRPHLRLLAEAETQASAITGIRRACKSNRAWQRVACSLPAQYPDFKPMPNFLPQRDRWYCYELMVKANTIGKNDGEVKYWIDGKLVSRLSRPVHASIQHAQDRRSAYRASTRAQRARQQKMVRQRGNRHAIHRPYGYANSDSNRNTNTNSYSDSNANTNTNSNANSNYPTPPFERQPTPTTPPFGTPTPNTSGATSKHFQSVTDSNWKQRRNRGVRCWRNRPKETVDPRFGTDTGAV